MEHKIYFAGNVQSLRFQGPRGETSVGVICPGNYSFSTESAERVRILTGEVHFRIKGEDWRRIPTGEAYEVPPRGTFEIECREYVSYICSFQTNVTAEPAGEPPLQLPSILEHTPSLVETVIRGFEDGVLGWRPNAQRWSATMVIAHLAEAEAHCFRPRLNRTALEDSPLLDPYDQWTLFRGTSVFSAPDALQQFKMEREKTLEFLRTLPCDVRTRHCNHQKWGRLTFAELLNEFAFHDMGHLRQILELCRARAYYPYMGAWQQYYQVNP